MNIFNKGALTALATTSVLVFTVASAADAVVYSQPDGTAHVDTGDVKAAFKWNNTEFDQRANGVTFGLVDGQNKPVTPTDLVGSATLSAQLVPAGAAPIVARIGRSTHAGASGRPRSAPRATASRPAALPAAAANRSFTAR